ncbi:P-loop containing nucleoside triphosphate hydrolase protein [Mycena haematopus]|nr:P-loop containing nucleoside triphosphate hydrolase protein [Mycena haematopus]
MANEPWHCSECNNATVTVSYNVHRREQHILQFTASYPGEAKTTFTRDPITKKFICFRHKTPFNHSNSKSFGDHIRACTSSASGSSEDEDSDREEASNVRGNEGTSRFQEDEEYEEPDINVGQMGVPSGHRRFCEKCQKRQDPDEGWVTCASCPVSAHWNCLVELQQKDPNQTSFVCDACNTRGFCIGCDEVIEATNTSSLENLAQRELLFSPATDMDTRAKSSQQQPKWLKWLCPDCLSFRYHPQQIIAWRPSPPNALEPPQPEPPSAKQFLPRQYLVKWEGRSYRRTSWVPHLWFQCAGSNRLQHFLRKALASDPNAQQTIPTAWTTPERVLDVMMWAPGRPSLAQYEVTTVVGQHPGSAMISLGKWEWECNAGKKLAIADLDQVAWALIKWQDLAHDDATWDSPPDSADGKVQFRVALLRFLASREVIHPLPETVESLRINKKYHLLQSPAVVEERPELKLLPYQIDGINWLGKRWWERQSSILADDMGLGKTVQIVVLVRSIVKQFGTMPVLVVAPKSTISNWTREFEKWAPELTVICYIGNPTTRKMIRDYELTHTREDVKPHAALKYHVLLTSYEGIFGPDFSPVFGRHEWEVVIVDEAQRLNGTTPLNNTIKDLLNLMVFLDPLKWKHADWTKADQILTEGMVQDLRQKLRPYILRRIKENSETELLVPMTLLQKEGYATLLRKNAAGSTSALHNLLMELRKCSQHPFLCGSLAPPFPSAEMSPENLVETSGKFLVLRGLLRELHKRGRRVLLFSQLKIALDLLETVLHSENYKFLRLDGDTDYLERGRNIDEFNKHDSEIFIFILTTRAGGVGINLFTADTVIIFDPDFNPQLDNQAIARAYRHGQTKTCLVFVLIVKNSVEERIRHNGRKKLILDDVVVQRLDPDIQNDQDVRSILEEYHKMVQSDAEGTPDALYTDGEICEIVNKAIAQAVKKDSEAMRA